MSDSVMKAITGDNESFNDFRKILAAAIAVVTGQSGVDAAAAADKATFQKQIEYAVGLGDLAEKDGVERLIDRAASHTSVFLHKGIEKMVNVGCRAVGGYIGNFCGPVGKEIGEKIGDGVAKILNTEVSVLIDKGIEKVKEGAKEVWRNVKEDVKEVLDVLNPLNWF